MGKAVNVQAWCSESGSPSSGPAGCTCNYNAETQRQENLMDF